MSGASLKPLIQSKAEVPTWRKGLFLENLYTGRDTPLQEAYLEGRAYERWGNAKKHWHTYTLDPHSGKPMAFKGLDFENGNDTSNSNSNSDYNTDPRTASEVKPAGTMVPVVVESGSYGGVDRTKRTLLFPKL